MSHREATEYLTQEETKQLKQLLAKIKCEDCKEKPSIMVALTCNNEDCEQCDNDCTLEDLSED